MQTNNNGLVATIRIEQARIKLLTRVIQLRHSQLGGAMIAPTLVAYIDYLINKDISVIVQEISARRE